jgi:hypothetical protein
LGMEMKKRGRILFKGNASPTVPGALESEDQKQALLLCACPRLFAGKGVHKKVGRKSTNGEFFLRATHPQQYRELANPKIENRRCCCVCVLGFAQRKSVHRKV